MKTASLPAVRIAPDLRKRAESQLHEGESLSAFVEEAVRLNIERREVDQAFLERGLDSLRRAQTSGTFHTAGKVLRELREDLASARARRAKTATE